MGEDEIEMLENKEYKLDYQLQQSYYKKAFLYGGFAATLMACVFWLYTSLKNDNHLGYSAIVMTQLSVSYLIFGIKGRATRLGKFSIVVSLFCLAVTIATVVLFFMNESGKHYLL